MLKIVKHAVGTLAVGMFMVPAFAQETKKAEKEKKADVEQIIITNKNPGEKMTIVVDGDKVTINGKDSKDVKDGHVIIQRNVNRSLNGARGNSFYRFDDENLEFFNEDENKAMLGVVTERDDEGAKIN